MKIFVTVLMLFCICLTIVQAEEGFFTRNMENTPFGRIQMAGYIECWRTNNQSPSPDLDTTLPYNPISPTGPEYLHWWVGGNPPIEYGWDYSFIGWRYDAAGGETLFSDYTPWRSYPDGSVCDTFDLLLQYETTRPPMPPRGQ